LTPAVVVNADSVMALGVVRALGRHHVPVIGLFRRASGFRKGRALVCASRYLETGADFDGPNYETALVAALLCTAAKTRDRPVLFPVSDRDMITISRVRDVLEPHYRLLLPPHDLLETLLAKERFAARAEALGLPVPRSFAIGSLRDAEIALDQSALPCVIKPSWRDGPWHRAHGDEKLLVAHTRDELHAGLQNALRLSPRLVVQELVDGPESEIVCSFAYLDEDGRMLELAACRKLRQHPPGFGNTALAESIPASEVEALTRDVCAKLGVVGYVSIEFKRDVVDSQLKILEVTPARLNRQAAVAELGGADLAWTWYRHLTGARGDSPIPRPGLRWASELNELRALPTYRRAPGWSAWAWLASFRRVRRFEILASDDPGPALALPLRAAGHGLLRRVRPQGKPKS
jgi:predicted ATP-grasp superfamily ATP-dependent carboligase